jgi:hypothetical protein
MSDVTELRDEMRYRLVTLDAVHAPEGCAGTDWFVYRILQGVNEITGYRSGARAAVRAEVDAIVDGLNERRSQIRPGSKAARRAASQIRLG